jgi:hypothetical protein
MRIVPLVLLCSCGALTMSAEQYPCTDVALDGEPALVIVPDGDDLLVYRTLAFEGEYDDFVPEGEVDAGTVFIRETWQADSDSFADLCWFPTVRLAGAVDRRLTIEWYDGDAEIPWFREAYAGSE